MTDPERELLDDDPLDHAGVAPARSGRRVAAVVAVGVAGIAAGLGVADLTSPAVTTGSSLQIAGPPGSTPGGAPGPSGTTSPSAPETPTTDTTTPSTSPSTSAASTTLVTTTSTLLPTTPSTVATTATTRVVTTPPPTAPPETEPPLPAVITVSYVQDASGALVITQGSAATVTLFNSGGSAGQWFLSPSNQSQISLSLSQGTIGPGESVTIAVRHIGTGPATAAITGVVAPSTRVTIKVTVR